MIENDFDKENTFALLLVGSRHYHDLETFTKAVDHIILNAVPKHLVPVIISGGANGADTLAMLYAKGKGYPFEEHPADWEIIGNNAGPIRNRKMHERIAEFKHRGVVAFMYPNSRGTKHSIRLSHEFNNPISIFWIAKNNFLTHVEVRHLMDAEVDKFYKHIKKSQVD